MHFNPLCKGKRHSFCGWFFSEISSEMLECFVPTLWFLMFSLMNFSTFRPWRDTFEGIVLENGHVTSAFVDDSSRTNWHVLFSQRRKVETKLMVRTSWQKNHNVSMVGPLKNYTFSNLVLIAQKLASVITFSRIFFRKITLFPNEDILYCNFTKVFVFFVLGRRRRQYFVLKSEVAKVSEFYQSTYCVNVLVQLSDVVYCKF